MIFFALQRLHASMYDLLHGSPHYPLCGRLPSPLFITFSDSLYLSHHASVCDIQDTGDYERWLRS